MVKVIKRNGQEVEFDINKIKTAIVKAYEEVKENTDEVETVLLHILTKINELNVTKISSISDGAAACEEA